VSRVNALSDQRPIRGGGIETYNQTPKPFKWTYTGKVLEA